MGDHLDSGVVQINDLPSVTSERRNFFGDRWSELMHEATSEYNCWPGRTSTALPLKQ